KLVSREACWSCGCYNRARFRAMLFLALILETYMQLTRGFLATLLAFSVIPLPAQTSNPTLAGYSAQNSSTEQQWEEKMRALPSPDNERSYMQRLSARPHAVGQPYDKDNAEWILSQFKSWGLDAHIEEFDVLFPAPKERALELVSP